MFRRGFTLLELLIVIAIIGILASIVLVSIDRSRTESKNKATISQMQEYQKALELVHTNTGQYPYHPTWANMPVPINNRVVCLGDNVGSLDCLTATSYGNAPVNNSTFNNAIQNALRQFMSSLPNIIVSGNLTLSSPGYHRCVSTGPNYNWNSTNNLCGTQYYSIWYVLQGNNQDCGPGIVADPNFTNDDPLTLCRLQSQ